MGQQESIEQWARTADFGEPLRWGSVEAAVLARPVDVEPVDPATHARIRRMERSSAIGTVAWLVVQLIVPVVGVIAIFMGLRSSADGALHGWLVLTDISFIIAFATVITTLFRSRAPHLKWADLTLTAWTAVAAIAALLLSGYVWLGLTHIILLGTAALALVTIVIVAVRRRSDKRRPRERLSDLTPEQIAYKGARARVLETLITRGLVDRDAIDIPTMSDMPLGTWHELDDQPDPSSRP